MPGLVRYAIQKLQTNGNFNNPRYETPASQAVQGGIIGMALKKVAAQRRG